jgi:imidazole glycerol-phosphate synthase subunit HisF
MKSKSRLMVALTLISEDAVKTKRFKDPVYLGDPINLTRLLSRFEIDELLLLDISQRYNNPKVSDDFLSALLESAFMPIGFGGGITSFEEAQKKFKLGFDKVAIKSGLRSKNLIEEIAKSYGQQSLVACLDIKVLEDHLEVNDIKMKVQELLFFVRDLEMRGIGEFLIHDIERDGTRMGFSLTEIANQIAVNVKVPIIIGGGISSLNEASSLLQNDRIDSVIASSIYVFDAKSNSVFISYPSLESRQDW